MTATATVCSTCGRRAPAKPICNMCRRPIGIWPDCPETFLTEAGWREVDGNWFVPPDRLSEGGLAKVGEDVDADGRTTPRYQFMPATPDAPHTLDQAVRNELWRRHGSLNTIEVVEPTYTEAQLAGIRQRQLHSEEPVDFVLASKRAEMRTTCIAQCQACCQWPNGWSADKVASGLAATRLRHEKRLQDAEAAAAKTKEDEAKRKAKVSK